MEKDYKGIAEEEFMTILLDWTIRTSLNQELSVIPALFLCWGEYSHSSQPLRFKDFKNLLGPGEFLERGFGIKDKETFLNNLMTDSNEARNVLLSFYETHFLKDCLLHPSDLKGTDLNYNTIIAMIANYSYYSTNKMIKEEAFIVEQVRFGLLFKLNLRELGSYITEILEFSALTQKQRKFIREGFKMFKEAYSSTEVKKMRNLDKNAKIFLKNLYKENILPKETQ